jgi:Putative DNA-binding domain
MQKLIEQLIQEKREGDWWDFKRQHHSNLIDLLHDILCMANIIYKGDRFIIFGVSDNFEVVGLKEGDVRHTQADILNFLRAKSFANHNIPKIRVDSFLVDGKELDVLTIKNESDKPYFLTRDEKKNGSTVRAGVVYSRLGDSNTPKDSSANPYEIEAMWRERFSLDKKASERFISVLLDFQNWKYDGISKAFYDCDPDYTIEIGGHEGSGGKFWWEEGLFEKPDRFFYHLKYKSVELHKIPIVRFPRENLKIPFPGVEFVTHPEQDDGCKIDAYCDLFYYLENSIEFSLFKHIRALEVSEVSSKSFSTPIETQIKPSIIKLPFIFFESEDRLKSACNELIEKFDDFLIVKNSASNISTSEDKLRKRYCTERLFSEWAYKIIYDHYV